MKKTFLLSIMMLTGAFAFANNGNGDTKKSEPKSTNNQTITQKSEEDDDDDALLYCKIELPDGIVVECWFCDCEELAKSIVTNFKMVKK